MAKPFSDFSGQFFWDFKRMDNVNYNFEIIECLYVAKKVNRDDDRFNKPIIVLIMAIIECTLYDFLVRINQYQTDPFPNIAQAAVAYIRNTNETDALRIIIPKIQSQNLLRTTSTDNLYNDLEHLRKIRNRLHIQNKYAMLPRDESRVFTDIELMRAQDCLEKIYNVLCNVYPRWRNQPILMTDFPRPWL